MSWRVIAAAGEPRASIRVRNLQATLGAGAAQDAWGRNGRAQPCLLSVIVELSAPFPVAAGSDTVAPDTVHYGTLSKALLKNVAQWQADATVNKTPKTLGNVLGSLWSDLTGLTLDGGSPEVPVKPVLNTASTSRLELTVMLPKASLVGEGVSLTANAVLPGSHTDVALPQATTLKLHRLRVPVLVGVHPHERTAKQIIIADVSLDDYGPVDDMVDEYSSLEAVVVGILEKSSFETLEALATHLARSVLDWGKTTQHKSAPKWSVHVALEKPIAVPSADAPVVEVRMSSE